MEEKGWSFCHGKLKGARINLYATGTNKYVKHSSWFQLNFSKIISFFPRLADSPQKAAISKHSLRSQYLDEKQTNL